MKKCPFVLWFNEISNKDTSVVGGKNASLGEMFQRLKDQKVAVPNGFAVTAYAYWEYLSSNDIKEKIFNLLNLMDTGKASLSETGSSIRSLILKGKFPESLSQEILEAYKKNGAWQCNCCREKFSNSRRSS